MNRMGLLLLDLYRYVHERCNTKTRNARYIQWIDKLGAPAVR